MVGNISSFYAFCRTLAATQSYQSTSHTRYDAFIAILQPRGWIATIQKNVIK